MGRRKDWGWGVEKIGVGGFVREEEGWDDEKIGIGGLGNREDWCWELRS